MQATAEAAGTHLTPRLLPPASQYRMSTARHCHTPAGGATDVDGKVAAWRFARAGLPAYLDSFETKIDERVRSPRWRVRE